MVQRGGDGNNEVSVVCGPGRSFALCLSLPRRACASSALLIRQALPWLRDAPALWTGEGGVHRRGCAAGQSVSRPRLLLLHAKIRIETRLIVPERLTRETGAPRADSVAAPEWPKRRSGAQSRRRRARWWQRQRCACFDDSFELCSRGLGLVQVQVQVQAVSRVRPSLCTASSTASTCAHFEHDVAAVPRGHTFRSLPSSRI